MSDRVEFTLKGVRHSLDAATVRTALRGGAPDEIRQHWVEVDGVRWPPKQAFALGTGVSRDEFISHFALRHLRALGFSTSDWRGSSPGTTGDNSDRRERLTPGPVAPPATPADAAADVVLVGCSNSKADGPRPAGELFTGTGFAKARAYALASGRPWYVLSAKFGLLDPTEVIQPYDVYLPDRSATYRAAWGAWVVAQLAERQELRGAVVQAHASRAYCEPLEEPLTMMGAELQRPLAGLSQGRQLAWYGQAPAAVPVPPDRPSVDVAPLLDPARAMPPDVFLATGREAGRQPGLYTWWADEAGAAELSAGLGHRVDRGLVYAGRAGGTRPDGRISTNSLWGRVAGMHLRGSREFSTFRLSLTAALQPVALDETALTAWIHRHLRVAVLPLPAAHVFAAEQQLLAGTDPPLNLRDVAPNPLRQELTRRRSALRTQG